MKPFQEQTIVDYFRHIFPAAELAQMEAEARRRAEDSLAIGDWQVQFEFMMRAKSIKLGEEYNNTAREMIND